MCRVEKEPTAIQRCSSQMTTKLVYGSPHPKNPFFKSSIEQHSTFNKKVDNGTSDKKIKTVRGKTFQWHLSFLFKISGDIMKNIFPLAFCSLSWLELIYFRLYVYDSLLPHMIRWGVSTTKKIESQTSKSYLWRESKILLHSLSHMSLYNMLLQVR